MTKHIIEKSNETNAILHNIDRSNVQILNNIKQVKKINKNYVPDDIETEYHYLCSDTAICQPYEFSLPRGIYLIELYGASGGSKQSVANAKRLSNSQTIPESDIIYRKGNAHPKPLESSAGSGAYTKGILSLKDLTQVFLHIGGKGEYSETTHPHPRGGNNGGGRGMLGSYMGGGGGGATDLRIGVDDPWHRVMVAAGGGGADGGPASSVGATDDGSGGCGGDLEGQGMWFEGSYKEEHIATQTSGFSFFQGEASQEEKGQKPNEFYVAVPTGLADKPGAGGGWFGGFSRHHSNAGAGGGSSFVLHRNAEIPTGLITVYDENYSNPVSKEYAFDTSSEYCFTHFEMFGGIWSGNGMARITLLSPNFADCGSTKNKSPMMAAILIAALFEGGF